MQGILFYLLPHPPSTVYTYCCFQDFGIHYSVQTSLQKDVANHCQQQVQALCACSKSRDPSKTRDESFFLLYYHTCLPFILISQGLAVGVLLQIQFCQHHQNIKVNCGIWSAHHLPCMWIIAPLLLKFYCSGACHDGVT